VVTVKIEPTRCPACGQWASLPEVEELVGRNRLYVKGTDPSRYVDLERAEADLLVLNLNYLVGTKAQILGG
jgi:hypothetical protein